MEQRILETDLNVSTLGLGCMGFSHAYGAPMERTEAVRLIQQAADMGYTFFLLPSQFTLDGYKAVFADSSILTGLINSFKYTIIGTVFSVVLTDEGVYVIVYKRDKMLGLFFVLKIFGV